MIRIPPPLQPGDLIGITCPAGYMEYQQAADCIATLQRWGYEVLAGHTLRSKSKNYFSGTDNERREEFQAMLDAPEVKAILCGRGGYGMSRIIDELDFTRFRKQPKWIAGFSDITVLHTHLQQQCKVASIHGPMAAAFAKGGSRTKYVQSLRNVFEGGNINYTCKAHRLNRTGWAEGILVGGNLALLAHVCGSKSEPDTRNKILFIEDVGEYLYNIDRMLLQLKRAGKLQHLSALLVGGFTDLKDTTRPFGTTAYQIIQHHISEYNYPVCFDFPVSHERKNLALICGCQYHLSVTASQVKLQQKI